MSSSVAGRKILIADSDVASRNFIARTLQGQQHEVIEVGSAKEGLIAAWRDQPELIIIEPALSDLKGEDFAARLRQDPRTAGLPLIALTADKNPAREKTCREAGFNAYILKSGQAIARLLDSINGLLGLDAAAPREGGLLIVFLSAKGGTGTSSLCANIATNIAQLQPQARIVVADMVLPIGSLAHIVGYTGDDHLVKVAELSPGETGSRYFLESLEALPDWRFHLLAGSPDPAAAHEMQPSRIGDIVRSLKSGFDFVVLDLGRSLSKLSLPLIRAADLLILITAADLSTITLTRILLEYLRANGVTDSRVFTILNRAVGLEGLTKPEAERALGLEIRAALPYLGGNFALANNQHRPFSIKYPGDTTSIIFLDVARKIVELARQRRAEPE